MQAVSRDASSASTCRRVLRIILVKLRRCPRRRTWRSCPFCARRCSSSSSSPSPAGCWAHGSCSAGSLSSHTQRARRPSRDSCVADASGVSPTLAGSPSRSATRAGVQTAAAAPREHGEGTALLLVAALAAGVILASDVFESGAAVDRLLFGTLLGLGPADLAISGRGRGVAVAAAIVLGRTWSASGSTRTARARWGSPRTAPTFCCWPRRRCGGRRNTRRRRAARHRGLRAARRGGRMLTGASEG